MTSVQNTSENQTASKSAAKPAPKKSMLFGMIVVVCVILVLGTVSALAYFRVFSNEPTSPAGLIFEEVKRGVFIHEVTDRGNVESAQNEDIRCQVESPSGTLIVWIIPEGTMVQEGDVLCRLDSSNLDEKVASQNITATNSKATWTQSTADYNIAKLALDEYTQGTYEKELKTIENKILKAEEDLSRAIETRGYTEKLLAQGYVTELQLKADKAKEEQLQNDLIVAKLERDVLEKYTSKKMTEQLSAAIVTAKAKMDSDELRYGIDDTRLKYYQTQLENCTIKAPKAGQVVYATPNSPWRRDSDVIKEGNFVRDRQIIIRLPDPRQMQVAGMVNEASVSQVKAGQPATITLEAMPSHEFQGTVKLVNDYPEPDGFMGSMTKEYKAIVSMNDLESLPASIRSGIRPGLTAQLRIDVTNPNDEDTPIMVTVQSLFEFGGKYYCITCDNGVWAKVPVEVGASNEKEVIIKSGLTEGMRVVQGAWRYIDHVLTEEERAGAKEFAVGGAKQRRGPGGGPNGQGGQNAGQGGPAQGGGQGAPANGPAPGDVPATATPGDAAPQNAAPPADSPNKQGDAPQENRPRGNRPPGDRPQGDRPANAPSGPPPSGGAPLT